MLSYFYFSEGQGFILVYSIASRSTFNRLKIFQQSIFRIKRQKPIFILVGNKCDKTHEREVTKAEGVALARSFGCSFLETSAKTGHNVELLFTNLVRGLRAARQTEVPDSQPLLKKKRGGGTKCYIM
jgi:GTPase KRas